MCFIHRRSTGVSLGTPLFTFDGKWTTVPAPIWEGHGDKGLRSLKGKVCAAPQGQPPGTAELSAEGEENLEWEVEKRQWAADVALK